MAAHATGTTARLIRLSTGRRTATRLRLRRLRRTGAVGAVLTEEATLGLTTTQVGAMASVYLLGESQAIDIKPSRPHGYLSLIRVLFRQYPSGPSSVPL